MKRTTTGALIAILAVTLAGCSSPSPGPVRLPDMTPKADALPTKCLTATDGAITALQDDITATMGDVEFSGHGVTKSESGDEFWFIAISFEDEDGVAMTGTWGTMQDPTANDNIAYVAVDDMAPLVSTYKQPAAFEGTTSSLVGANDCIPG